MRIKKNQIQAFIIILAGFALLITGILWKGYITKKSSFLFGEKKLIIFEIDTEAVLSFETRETINNMRTKLKTHAISYEMINQKAFNRIEVQGLIKDQEVKLRNILLQDFPEWDSTILNNTASLNLKKESQLRLIKDAVAQDHSIIKKRLDKMNISTLTHEYGKNRIVIDFTNIANTEQVIKVIESRANLEFREVSSGPFESKSLALKEYSNQIPDDLEIIKINTDYMSDKYDLKMRYYVLKNEVVVSGGDLQSVKASRDMYGQPAIGIRLTPESAEKFKKYTSVSIGKKLAIVFDDQIIMAPIIHDRIPGDMVINGRFTRSSVDRIVLLLRSGTLAAPLKMVGKKTIPESPEVPKKAAYLPWLLIGIGMFLMIIGMLLFLRRRSSNTTYPETDKK